MIRSPGGTCDWCTSQGLSCTFDRVIHKDPNKRYPGLSIPSKLESDSSGRTTTDVVQELSQRVEQLEEAIRSASSGNTPVGASWPDRAIPEVPRQIPYYTTYTPTAAGQQGENVQTVRANPTETPAPAYRLSRCQLGNNWYFKGVGILSSRGRQWIYEGTGQRSFLENFDIFGNPIGAVPCASSPALSERERQLPPEQACRYLFDAFLRSKTSIVFPILDRPLFEETILRAYDVKNDPGTRSSAEACVWAMFALVARTEEAQQVEFFPEADCIQEAKRLLTVVNGAVNLDSLQATLLLVGPREPRLVFN